MSSEEDLKKVYTMRGCRSKISRNLTARHVLRQEMASLIFKRLLTCLGEGQVLKVRLKITVIDAYIGSISTVNAMIFLDCDRLKSWYGISDGLVLKKVLFGCKLPLRHPCDFESPSASAGAVISVEPSLPWRSYFTTETFGMSDTGEF